MSYILTGSKIKINPLHPEKDEILIEDIAHALSQLCRANGHFPEFYSVAQHCLACAEEARLRGLSPRLQLACLIHDASEAYISDITRPVKKVLPQYLEIEKPLQNSIWNKWLSPALTDEEKAQVFKIDNEMLYHEFYHYMNFALYEEAPEIKFQGNFYFEEFKTVETAYMNLFTKLIEEL